jgi:serine/threonine-protein kinase
MTEELDHLKSALADRYTIEREIGSGGMAVVYRAEDLKHKRKVALKVLRPELAAAVGTERFVREIETTANLTHPNILPLLDSGSVEEQPSDRPAVRPSAMLFYVMPYIEGESLRDRIDREKQLPIDDAVAITREIADALSYAHSHGIIHRDVKPENVLFQSGHAVVADFGIARAVTVAAGDQLTETGLAVGTPTYMSPEQATGASDIDARSDIYSVGCLLFEMLAGDPPFTASTAQGLLARKSVEAVPALSTLRETVPTHVETAVTRALSRIPADRFTTVLEFSEALVGDAKSLRGVADPSAVAVLPFVNMSADPENEYFSDGITEEVINAVAGIRGLRVTARTSAFQFKNKEYDIREIGSKLSVGTVLEGSVRKAGRRVRVTAQLIDVADGYHLWSEKFDRELEDVFAIQDEIAEAIAQRLAKKVAHDEDQMRDDTAGFTAPARADATAYDAYLRGRFYRQRMFGGGDAVLKAEANYLEAIDRDPEFALAHSALAELYTVLSIGFALRPVRELMPKARESAERALALDPMLADAHLARALVAMHYEWDYSAAKRGIDRALEINPSFVDAHFWAEFYWTYVERNFESAVAANRRAAELDPLDLNIRTRLSQVLILFGHFDEAIDQLELIVQLAPDFMVAYLELADAYTRKHDYERGAAAAERAIELSGEALVGKVMGIIAYSRGGVREKAEKLLRELIERAEESYVYPFWLAVAFGALGDIDRSFEYLEQAVEDRDCNLMYLSAVPADVGWHDDPRYARMLERIGLGHLAGRNDVG